MYRKLRYYGIKFPFTKVGEMNTFVDLNDTKLESVKSQLIHLIYTPVGQRLRNPNFGTKLIQFLFSPNDAQTKDDIEFEIKETIKKFIPDCELLSIETTPSENGDGLNVTLKFTATIDAETINDQVTITI